MIVDTLFLTFNIYFFDFQHSTKVLSGDATMNNEGVVFGEFLSIGFLMDFCRQTMIIKRAIILTKNRKSLLFFSYAFATLQLHLPRIVNISG